MSDRFRRWRGPALGLVAGITLTLGAVSTSGFATFGTQAAAASFPLADGGTADADAGAAGTVQIQRNGDQLTITGLSPAAGWTPVVERQTGREVEVTFSNGTDTVHLELELEDGEVKVDRGPDDDGPGTPAPAPGTSTTYDAGAAGQVVVTTNDDGSLSISDVLAAAGWSVEIEEGTGNEVEVTFRNGDQRIDFKAEVEDGEVRIRVRDRAQDDADDDGDDDGDDDNSGPGSANSGRGDDDDSDDDNSGPSANSGSGSSGGNSGSGGSGGGGDDGPDHDVDDDHGGSSGNSGSGNSGSGNSGSGNSGSGNSGSGNSGSGGSGGGDDDGPDHDVDDDHGGDRDDDD